MKTKKLSVLILSLCLAVCVAMFTACGAGASNGTANDSQKNESAFPQRGEEIVNPFTGLEDKEYDPRLRPVAIMVNNIFVALPQTGLSDADIIYETVTEGGITRLLAVYPNVTDVKTVGPVRSLRDAHLQLSLPYQPLYVHIGASKFSKNMLSNQKYEDKDLDGTFGVVRDYAFYLDEERHLTKNMEHCFYTTGEKIKDSIEHYELNSQLATPIEPIFSYEKKSPRLLADGAANNVKFDFSNSNTAEFAYNKYKNVYEKSEFDMPQIDTATKEPLSFENVFVLFTDITLQGDGVLTNVNLAYSGYGLYFSNGSYERIRWVKGGETDPLRMVDANGNETDIQVNKGKSYVSFVDYANFDTLTVNGNAVALKK